MMHTSSLLILSSTLAAFCTATFIPVATEDINSCEREWKKVGCYHDRIFPSRVFTEHLVSIDGENNPVWDTSTLDWENYAEKIHGLACRCSHLAKQKGYRYFGLQFYGECWSGPTLNFSRDGLAWPTQCHGPTFKYCNDESEYECVGKAFTSYIYDTNERRKPCITDETNSTPALPITTQTPPISTEKPATKSSPPPPPVETTTTKQPTTIEEATTTTEAVTTTKKPSEWSLWSEWTPCSKRCAGGVRTRSRHCENPIKVCRDLSSLCKNFKHGCDSAKVKTLCCTTCTGKKSHPLACGKYQHDETLACNKEACYPVCTNKLDVAFIVDASSSVTEANFNRVRSFLMNFVTMFKVGSESAQFGLVYYANTAKVQFKVANYTDKADMLRKIEKMPYIRGYTRTDKGVRKAEYDLFCKTCTHRPYVPNVIVVITNGEPHINSEFMDDATSNLKNDGVTFLSVGVGKEVGKTHLEMIASKKEYVFQIQDYKYLQDIINKLRKTTCESQGVCKDDAAYAHICPRFKHLCSSSAYIKGWCCATCKASLVMSVIDWSSVVY